MGKVENSGFVHHNALSFSDSEAKTLHNSKGAKNGRLHLLEYDGMEGGDRYAVVAEKMTFDGEAKLGWWDRKWNILVEGAVENGVQIYYKINKNSFLKRINPSMNLDINEDTGLCRNLDEALESRVNALGKLQEKSNATNPFEKEFLHQLSRGQDADAYNQILFVPVEDNLIDWKAPEVQKQPVLIITYDKDDEKVDNRYFYRLYNDRRKDLGQASGVHVNHSQYQKILSGKSIPESINYMIKNEKIGLPFAELEIGVLGAPLALSPDTRPSDIEKYIAERKASISEPDVERVIDIKNLRREDEGIGLPLPSFNAKIKDVQSFVILIQKKIDKKFSNLKEIQ